MACDHQAIASLIYTYGERVDAGDFEGVADLLADADVTFEGSPHTVSGRGAVLAMYTATTRRYDDGTPRTKHLMTNVMVEVDEGAGLASSRSCFTVLQAVPGELALQPVIAGRYHDRFARPDGAWRFAKVHMIVDLVGELGHHLLEPLPFSLGP